MYVFYFFEKQRDHFSKKNYLMAEYYNIGSSTESKVRECCPFDVQGIELETEYSSSTYSEILKIFREAFSMVDITQIIKKL